jgi:hypothetical protein
MRRLLIGLIAMAAALHAADVTGTWSGSLAMTRGDETKEDTALLVLKQTGGTITGTAGPNEDRRMEITKGTSEGDNVYFEVVMEGENKLVFRLKLEGGKLVGELKAEGPGAPPISGKMSLSKGK